MNHDQEITNEEYIVTTFGSIPESTGAGDRVLSSQLWDGLRPFGVGYPFRYVLEGHQDGIRIRNLGSEAEKVINSPLRHLSEAELSGTQPIELDGPKPLWMTIQPVPRLSGLGEGAWVPPQLPMESTVDPLGERMLHRVALVTGVFSLLVLIGVWMTPERQKEEALIPPQFAKILLSPATKSPETKRSKGPDEKVEPGNVVAAFQSEAVKKTTRTLLDASAAKALLSKSSILDSSQSKAALKGLFNKKSKLSDLSNRKSLDLSGLDRGLANTKSTRSAGGYRGNAAESASKQGAALVAVANEGVGVADGLTKDEVGKVIRQHLGEIRYCYESALAREPGLEGKLVVSFTVGSTGQVKDVGVKQSSGSEALDQCIGNRLTDWKFPKPRQGVDVGVSYPFIFKSLGG